MLAEREEGFIDYSKAGRKQSTEIKSPPPSSPAPTPASPPPAPSPPPNARPSPPPNHSPAPAPSHPTPHSPRKLRRKSLSAPPSPVSPPAPALSKPKPSPPPPSLNLKRAPSKPKSLKSTLGRQPAVERGIAVGPPLEGLSWAEEGVAVDGEEEHDSAKVQTHEQKVDLTLSAEDRHYLHRILVKCVPLSLSPDSAHTLLTLWFPSLRSSTAASRSNARRPSSPTLAASLPTANRSSRSQWDPIPSHEWAAPRQEGHGACGATLREEARRRRSGRVGRNMNGIFKSWERARC